MNSNDQISEFLRRAHNAVTRALAAADPIVKADWARIAMGYEDLAQTVKNTVVMEQIAEQPSLSSAPIDGKRTL